MLVLRDNLQRFSEDCFECIHAMIFKQCDPGRWGQQVGKLYLQGQHPYTDVSGSQQPLTLAYSSQHGVMPDFLSCQKPSYLNNSHPLVESS